MGNIGISQLGQGKIGLHRLCPLPCRHFRHQPGIENTCRIKLTAKIGGHFCNSAWLRMKSFHALHSFWGTANEGGMTACALTRLRIELRGRIALGSPTSSQTRPPPQS